MWWRSFAYLRRHRLRRFHLAGPAVLLALAAASIYFTRWLTATLTAFVHGFMPEQLPLEAEGGTASDVWSGAMQWVQTMLDSLIEWGVILLVLWLKVKVVKYLIITLMAPFMSALAAAVVALETGESMPFSWGGLLRDILRGVRISLVLLTMELVLGAALWLTGLALALFAAPLAVLLAPVLFCLSWAIGAYFFGAAVYDAVYEQAGLSWRHSLRMGWQQRGHLFGIGALFSLLMGIPVIGPYIAALLGPVPCTTAAAQLYFSPRPKATP